MKNIHKRGKIASLLILFILMFSLTSVIVSAQNNSEFSENTDKVTIYFFWGEGCPHCETEKPYLEEWQEEYGNKIEVKMFETWKNSDNVPLFQEAAAAYGIEARGVPTTFIGEKNWIGFSDRMASEMESYIQECISQGCKSPLNDLNLKGDNEQNPEEIEKIEKEELCLHVFINENCSQCNSLNPYLESLEKEYKLDIRKYDISFEENKTLFKDFRENYGLKAEMYPTVFIGENYISGEESIRTALESEIENCLNSGCPCPISKIKPYTPIAANQQDVTMDKNQTIDVPFIGEINLSSMSLGVVTGLMGFVDGFNPCSLWVLTFLLGIVIYTGSRKKIVAVGLTFLLVTTTAYGLFMVGLLNVFQYVGYLTWIQIAVALIAGIFAIVNIKDYFWYKKGISFTISDKYKPKIFKSIRNLMKGEGSTGALILGTAIMALGIVLVELPCTAGFPVIWANIMANNNVVGMSFFFLLLLYLGIYLLDELVVFTTVAVTLKASRFEEKHGRILKLIGGIIMLALAIVLVTKPELMDDVGSALLIFGIAVATSFLIIWLHRKVLPKYGIKIGTESLEHKETGEEKKKKDKEKSEDKKEEKINRINGKKSLKNKEELNNLKGKNDRI